jgi:hypothetical protein
VTNHPRFPKHSPEQKENLGVLRVVPEFSDLPPGSDERTAKLVAGLLKFFDTRV